MNELITKEMVETGIVPETVFDFLEEYKTVNDRMETLKFEFRKMCEQYGFKKWETDYFVFTYIAEASSVRVDVKRMKDTDIYVADALTGELEEVNAYEYFSKPGITKAHVTYKEKI